MSSLLWVLLTSLLLQPGAANLNPAGGLRQAPAVVDYNPYFLWYGPSVPPYVTMPVINPDLGVGYQSFPVFWWLDPFYLWNPYNLPYTWRPTIVPGSSLLMPPTGPWFGPPWLAVPSLPLNQQTNPADAAQGNPPPRVPPRAADRPTKDAVEQAAKMQKELAAGNAAFAQGNYATALRHYEQASQAQPLEALPQFHQAQALFALGQYPKAIALCQRAMKWLPNWPSAAFAPRKLYGERGTQFDQHLSQLAQAVEKNPNDGGLLFLLGYQLWFDGQPEKARVLFRRAASLTVDTAAIDPFLK